MFRREMPVAVGNIINTHSYTSIIGRWVLIFPESLTML